jgi:hypothetical protein
MITLLLWCIFHALVLYVLKSSAIDPVIVDSGFRTLNTEMVLIHLEEADAYYAVIFIGSIPHPPSAFA